MAGSQSWVDAELAGSAFADERLGKRLRVLLEQMGGAVGESLPMACQDWAATKAAYRFFSKSAVFAVEFRPSEPPSGGILAEHAIGRVSGMDDRREARCAKLAHDPPPRQVLDSGGIIWATGPFFVSSAATETGIDGLFAVRHDHWIAIRCERGQVPSPCRTR